MREEVDSKIPPPPPLLFAIESPRILAAAARASSPKASSRSRLIPPPIVDDRNRPPPTDVDEAESLRFLGRNPIRVVAAAEVAVVPSIMRDGKASTDGRASMVDRIRLLLIPPALLVKEMLPVGVSGMSSRDKVKSTDPFRFRKGRLDRGGELAVLVVRVLPISAVVEVVVAAPAAFASSAGIVAVAATFLDSVALLLLPSPSLLASLRVFLVVGVASTADAGGFTGVAVVVVVLLAATATAATGGGDSAC